MACASVARRLALPDGLHWPTVNGRITGDLYEEVRHFAEAVRDDEPFVITPGRGDAGRRGQRRDPAQRRERPPEAVESWPSEPGAGAPAADRVTSGFAHIVVGGGSARLRRGRAPGRGRRRRVLLLEAGGDRRLAAAHAGRLHQDARRHEIPDPAPDRPAGATGRPRPDRSRRRRCWAAAAASTRRPTCAAAPPTTTPGASITGDAICGPGRRSCRTSAAWKATRSSTTASTAATAR